MFAHGPVDDGSQLVRVTDGGDAANRLAGDGADLACAGIVTDCARAAAAIRWVSVRCRPLVMTSSGSPSARKSRLLAIAPGSQSRAAAAWAAVCADSVTSRTSTSTPPAEPPSCGCGYEVSEGDENV